MGIVELNYSLEREVGVYRTHRKGKNNVDAETYDRGPKFTCLSEEKDLNIRDMLVLIAGCDTLASGLKKGVRSKFCCEISRDISRYVVNEKRK